MLEIRRIAQEGDNGKSLCPPAVQPTDDNDDDIKAGQVIARQFFSLSKGQCYYFSISTGMFQGASRQCETVLH